MTLTQTSKPLSNSPKTLRPRGLINIIFKVKRFYKFLQEDSWQSWIVSLALIIIFIKLIFFPGLSLLTQSSLPLVVVESCSMYHQTSNIENWWNSNGPWYKDKNISEEQFTDFPFKNGLNKGDIILLTNYNKPKIGDIIIFQPNSGSTAKNPIIHRVVSSTDNYETKGDNNPFQFNGANNNQNLSEININQNQILGKSSIRIPLIGWLKLIFFEPSRSASQKGLCR